MTRFTSADVDAAHSTWGCNCGPAALAAICNLTLDEVRPLFPDFPGYTNPTRMFAALKSTGGRWNWSSVTIAEQPPTWPSYGIARIQWLGPWMQPGVPIAARYKHTHWVGVSRLQPMAVSIDPEVSFGRPVLRGTRVQVSVAADLAVAGETPERIAQEFGVDTKTVRSAIAWHRGEGETCIWDVNQLDIGDGWAPLAWWTQRTVPTLTDGIKRASGGWSVTHAIEVERP